MALQENTVLQGRYEIHRIIKSGGMGSVYEATDTRHGRPCAVKEMLEAVSLGPNSELVRRKFQEEAALLFQLRHPGIPAVIDFFGLGSTCYIVMELIHGANLEQELADRVAMTRRPFEPQVLVQDAMQVLEILTYLHGLKPPVVHRDIKPANLIREFKTGKIRLVDFGLARVVDSLQSQTTVGTLGYAPLEQMQGHAEPRSDLYSLGVTMHHLVTGQTPGFMILKPLSEAAPLIHPKLAAIIERATQIKAEDRFPSAEAMLAALREGPGPRLAPLSQTPDSAPSPAPAPSAPTSQLPAAPAVAPSVPLSKALVPVPEAPPSPAQVQRVAPEAKPKKAAAGTSILVLEDDENMRELLVEYLEDSGYFTQGAACAAEALDLAQHFAFDLVVSDVRMAGELDGLGALAALKRKLPELRTIVITGYASEDAPKRAIDIQVDDYLYKPLTLSDLRGTVKRVLSSGRERTGYRAMLAALMAGPKKLIEKAEAARREQATKGLEAARDRTYQAFYVAVRSKLLTKGAALDAWDQLERLEKGYEAASSAEKVTPAQIQSGTQQYQQLYELMTAMAQSQTMGSLKNREAWQVDRPTFGRFYDRIQEGRVSPEQVRIACSVWRSSPQTRSQQNDLEALYQTLWGKLEPA